MSMTGANELLMAVSGNKERQLLVMEKLEHWNWFERFIAQNPDVAARWEQHKTYEILKDEHGK